MRGVNAFLMLLMSVSPVMADEIDDDVAFFEFLGSFEAEDDEWLDSHLNEDAATDDTVPERAEAEEDQ